MNQRSLACDIIYRTIFEKAYTNLLVRESLNQLPKIQRAFVSNLVNGTLKEYDYLLYQIEINSAKLCKPRLRALICCALYEKFFLDTPEYTTNEYVSLGHNKSEKAFINALLHKIDSLQSAPLECINQSIPNFIYDMLSSQYDKDSFVQILKNYKEERSIVYRINHHKCTYKELENLPISILDNDCFTSKVNLLESSEFQNGFFYIQDFNSNQLVKNLNLTDNDVLLDACSAPGSKLFNALDIVKPENCYANDLHEHRVKLIEKAAEKLGFKGIHYSCRNACELGEVYGPRFTKIILDVPCSGLGVIGRKPDIKFHLTGSDFDNLQNLQKNLLDNVSLLLKKDGLLLYSTCTLNKKENSRQVKNFIDKHSEFCLLKEETIISEQNDCFYFAVLKRL